jgi:hypothetical protein
MEEEIRERIILPAGEIEQLFSNEDIVVIEEMPRVGFNFNKLLAVACMLSSALVSVAVMAWWFLA